jgi:hypothetical protein
MDRYGEYDRLEQVRYNYGSPGNRAAFFLFCIKSIDSEEAGT